MKQFIFLCLMTGVGWIGSFFFSPYIGLWVYYFFTCLRPQYLWEWSMQGLPIGHWAFYTSIPLIGTFVLWNLGLISYRKETTELRYRPAVTPGHFLLMAFGFWIALSYFFSTFQHISHDWFGEYVKIIVMFMIGSRIIRHPEHVRYLLVMIGCVLSYIALEAFWTYLKDKYLVIYKRGFAGLDNNGAALMLAMGVPILYFLWELTKGWYRHLFLVAIPVVLYAVLTSYSRGAMLATLAGAPLYMLYARNKKLMLVFYLCGAVFVGVAAGKEIQERFISVTEAEADGSFQSRLVTWKIAFSIARDYPFFGVGIRCSNKFTFERGADMEGRTIHSQYLQILADSGYPALLLYLAMMGFGIYACWRTRLRLWHRTDEQARMALSMLGGIEISLVIFLVGAAALSLEVFELPYLVLLLAYQMWAMANATDSLSHRVLPAMPGQVVGLRVSVPSPVKTPMPASFARPPADVLS